MTAVSAPARVVAVVKDLFFVARIRESARLAGVPIQVARTPEELGAALEAPPAFVLLDLTTPGWDYQALFTVLDQAVPRPSVVAFTTHVLASHTKPWHGRCDRVVTKETLTRELGDMLRGALR
jgi:CheY-like chemotaxis protein